MMMTQTFFI